MVRFKHLLAAASMAGVALWNAPSKAADLLAFSDGPLRSALQGNVDESQSATGHKVQLLFGTAPVLRAKLKAREQPDVLITLAAEIDEMEKHGKFAATMREVARIKLAFAVRRGAPKSDVATVHALKQTQFVGVSPQEAQGETIYSAGAYSTSKSLSAARALATYLAGAKAATQPPGNTVAEQKDTQGDERALSGSPALVANEDWLDHFTVLTMSPGGAWGIATERLINRAIAVAISNCKKMSGTELGCGADFTTIRAGWSLGIRCGRRNIIVAEKNLADAERSADRREIDLRAHYVPDMPTCVRLVTVDPNGASVVPKLGSVLIPLR